MNPHLTPVFVSMLCFTGCAIAPVAGRPLADRDRAPLSNSPDVQPHAAVQASGGEPRSRVGPWELAVGGAGSSNSDFDAGGAQAGASLGYYFNDVVELSVRQNAAYGDAGPSSPEIWNFASRVALDIHVPLGKFVPYFGANLGYVYGDTIADSMMGGPEVGAKLYLQDDAFLQIGAEYQFFFDKGDSLETAFDDGQFLYTLGMGLRL
jgi:hypothetical protein